MNTVFSNYPHLREVEITAGGGRPDAPNTGFSVENDSRDLESNWARDRINNVVTTV
jgi:hypothetical protein